MAILNNRPLSIVCVEPHLGKKDFYRTDEARWSKVAVVRLLDVAPKDQTLQVPIAAIETVVRRKNRKAPTHPIRLHLLWVGRQKPEVVPTAI
eukprot:m.27542 g.27542  ORF g.27542 m.27542 type:complete len:92 (+) comp10266_c0_seq2:284-559(+)